MFVLIITRDLDLKRVQTEKHTKKAQHLIKQVAGQVGSLWRITKYKLANHMPTILINKNNYLCF